MKKCTLKFTFLVMNSLAFQATLLYIKTYQYMISLLCKSMDWFLYDNGLRHERVK